MHNRVCEICGEIIPKEYDNKAHYGWCQHCKKPVNYVIADNKEDDLLTKKIIMQENNNLLKKNLLQRYGVYEENPRTGTLHIRCVNLGELIWNECYKFITIEDEATGKQDIYYYEDGFYKPGGENRIREKVDYYLGMDTSIHRKNEVVDYIKHKKHMLRRNFEPPARYINLRNGVFDIENMKLLPHSSSFYFLNQLPIKYDEKADCLKIKEFFNQVLYPEYVKLMQEIFGFILYRDYFLHKAILFYGGGRNGKGTTIRIIKSFLGYGNFSSQKLSELVEDKFAKADLYGKMANLGAEMSGRALEDTSDFKHLTGGEPISARFLYHGSFSFVNYAKLIFNTNHIPYPKYDRSTAYFRRWIIIPFPETFDEDNPNTDPDIIKKLTTQKELSGLFNWAVMGLKRILKNNRFSYFDDENENEIGERYEMLAKPDMRFIKEHLFVDAGAFVKTDDVYDRYVEWADKRRFPILSKGAFSRSVKRYMVDKTNNVECEIFNTKIKNKDVRCYRNISWKKEFENIVKIKKLDITDYPADKLKRLRETIDRNRNAGYRITMDFLRNNFSDSDINHFLESGYLIRRADGEYECG